MKLTLETVVRVASLLLFAFGGILYITAKRVEATYFVAVACYLLLTVIGGKKS
jgi:hypothetical protein